MISQMNSSMFLFHECQFELSTEKKKKISITIFLQHFVWIKKILDKFLMSNFLKLN